MNQGLLMGISEMVKSGVESYRSERSYQQQKVKDAEEQALKRRLARGQEVEAAAKIADVTGTVPKGLFSEEVDQAFNPEKPAAGLMSPSPQSAGMVSAGGESPITGDAGFLTRPVDTPFMPKHVREGIERATQLSATNYGKGVTYKYDPDRRIVVQSKAQRSEEHEAELENKNLEIAKKREDLAKVNKEQGDAALFGKRMEQAEAVFTSLDEKGYDRTGLAQDLQSSKYYPGFLQGGNLKEQEQAERNFINATLRRESGAAISPTEFQNAEQQYFPRPGDTPEVLKQKKENRLLARNAMQQQAGKAWAGLAKPNVPLKPKQQGSSGGGLVSGGLGTAQAAGAGPHGASVVQGGVTFDWDGKQYVPRAQ